jgi:formylglycine-generating enzyme required for sulfatase activity
METPATGKKPDANTPASAPKARTGHVIHVKSGGRGAAPARPPLPPVGRWQLIRPFTWLGLIAVLLLVIWISLGRLADVKPSAPFVPPPPPSDGPVLGNFAIILPGLKEVVPPKMPSTVRLAPGSAEAQARQVAFSKESRLPIEVENSLGIHFRLIPPGTYVMGSPPSEAERDEVENQHTVTLYAPVYMSVCEITQAQWSKLMPENPSGFRPLVLPKNTVIMDEVRKIAAASAVRVLGMPVEEVSWSDAIGYAKALAEKEGLPVGTYRLPFEVEWEYACRAGTRTAYYFGDNPEQLGHYADYSENNGREPNIVGQRLPNAFGLFDMLGNVSELCFDKIAPYPVDACAPPPSKEVLDAVFTPAIREGRVVRGGNWFADTKQGRAAWRFLQIGPTGHANFIGFRLVRTIPEYRGSGQRGPQEPPFGEEKVPAPSAL